MLFGLIASCKESDSERRAAELEHAKLMAEVEFEKERRLTELKEAAIEEERRTALAAQAAFDSTALGQRVKVVKDLYFQSRGSLMNDGERVLIIVNPSSMSADIKLLCRNGGGYEKTIDISVPANGRKEIGFLEGWSFKNNDEFEVLYNGKAYHSKVFE